LTRIPPEDSRASLTAGALAAGDGAFGPLAAVGVAPEPDGIAARMSGGPGGEGGGSGRAGRLSAGQLAAFGVGGVVEGAGYGALQMFQFFYMTAVCGLSGTLTSLSIAVSLIVDALADPFIGSVSDNLHSRLGRRHPLMLLGIPLSGLALGLTYSLPRGMGQYAIFVYFTCVSLIYRLGLSAFILPHTAMGFEISGDYRERTTLRIVTGVFVTLATVTCISLGMLVFMPTGEAVLNRADYVPFGWTIGLLLASGGTLCWLTTLPMRLRMRGPTAASASERWRLRVVAAEVFSNPAFRTIFFTAMIWFIAGGIVFALALHANRFFWRLPNWAIQATSIAMPVGALLSIPVSAAVSNFEKRRVVIGALLVIFALGVSLAPLRIAGLLPVNGPLLYGILMAASALYGMASACISVFFGSMVGDAVDQHELLFGTRREGLFFSGMTLSAKVGGGLGAISGGLMLDAIGFPHDPGLLAADALSTTQIDGLGLIQGPLAALLFASSLIWLRRYRIDRAEHRRIQAALSRRDLQDDP